MGAIVINLPEYYVYNCIGKQPSISLYDKIEKKFLNHV